MLDLKISDYAYVTVKGNRPSKDLYPAIIEIVELLNIANQHDDNWGISPVLKRGFGTNEDYVDFYNYDNHIIGYYDDVEESSILTYFDLDGVNLFELMEYIAYNNLLLQNEIEKLGSLFDILYDNT